MIRASVSIKSAMCVAGAILLSSSLAMGGTLPIATGPDPSVDGYLAIVPDEFGSWTSTTFGGGGDIFNPSGRPTDLEAAFTSGFFLFVPSKSQRELLSENASWQAVFPADATLSSSVTSPLLASDCNDDEVDDTLTSSFDVTGGLTDLSFDLMQRVMNAAGPMDSAVLTQTYTITNNSPDPISFILVRVFDGDLLWSGDIADDEVGTTMHGAGLGPYVFQQEAGDPAVTAITLSGLAGNNYFGGKHGLTPGGGAPPYDFGTDTEVWDAFGIPTSWESHIAGVGYSIDGLSGTAPAGSTPPEDGFVGLDFPIDLGAFEIITIAVLHTYGQNTPGAAILCPAPCVAEPALCDDGDQCTDDFCDAADPEADENGCAHTPSPLGEPCEADDNLCTIDQCDGNGACVTFDNVTCEAPCPPCEGDCDPATGLCPCVFSVQDGDWTDPNTWNIPGFPMGYPDSVNSVAVGAAIFDTVTLDANVEVPSVCVLFGGNLNVTTADRGNLSVGPDGLFVRGLLPDVFSTVRVAFDRQISVPEGTVIFAANSVYERLRGAVRTTAAMNARSILLFEEEVVGLEGRSLVGAARMDLDQSMCINASQEFRFTSVGDVKDNCEPIDLITADEAEIRVGDGTSRETASFNILVDTIDIDYDSAQPLRVCGDFINESTTSDEFDWAEGGIEFTCPDPFGGDPFGGSQFTIEAAGRNIGPQIIGLCNNFAFGTLTVGNAESLLVVDLFDNQQDGLEVVEAVYVDHLVVLNGATLATANGVQLFYKTLLNQGDIPGLGVDVIEADQECPDLNGDGVVGAFDLAMLLGAWGPCVAGQSCCADLNGDGLVEAFDLAMLLGAWGSCR